MANTYLSRTQGTATLGRKYTFSCWIKRSKITDRQQFIRTTGYGYFEFQADDKLHYYDVATGGDLVTNKVFRDTNAWYHIVLSVDTTLATADDRHKIYINGVQETSFADRTNPTQNNGGYFFDDGRVMYIGSNEGSNLFFNGCISHLHGIDGTAYDASAFGSFDNDTGEWSINTSPSVTYGNNGFFILKDGNSVTDQSGNSNNFTVAGGTLTKTEDNPSNVFATLNPLHTTGITGNYFLSLGNLRQNVTDNDGHRETGFTLHPKGLKGYFEVKCTVDPNFHLGLQNVASALGKTNYYTLASPNYYYMQASNPVKISYANGGSSANHIADYFSQISVGDIIGCAFDFTGTNKNVWFHKNGTYGSSGGYVGNPANGTYPAMSSTQLTADEYEFIISPNTGSGNGQLDFNFGNGYFGTTAVSSAGTNASNNGIFEYDVPSGFTALSTKGLNL
jgi:hypothetical protein